MIGHWTTRPSASIGVGIIGLSATGGWAGSAHVPALAAVGGFELRALTASSRGSARASASRYGVAHPYADARAMIERDDVDLVVVAVKVPDHRDSVLAAIDAGKMVLSEWPLGRDLAETEELHDRAAAAGVRTAVGLQARAAPAILYLRDLVAGGYVGRVLSTSVVAAAAAWGPTVDARSVYQLDPANGATMLTIPFAHTVDALTMVLGEFAEIDATVATRRPEVHDRDSGRAHVMAVEDQIAVTGTLRGGAVASVHFRGGLTRGTNFLWEINGTDGDLQVTADWAHLQFGEFTLRGGRETDTGLTEMATPPSYRRVPALDGETAGRAYNVAHGYAQLRDDIDTGTDVTPGFAHAVHRHRFLERIRRG